MSKNLAIGVDIGGTKISIALGNRNGKILARAQIKTLTGSQTQKCVESLTQQIQNLIDRAPNKKSDIAGIGIGLPGAVDHKKGIVPLSPHLSGWQKMPLRAKLEKQFKLPVRMANDANAAALAEKVFGQAKNAQNFIYMTVSTGIGGGLFVNGQLLEGANFVAGEVGHMTIQSDGGQKWKLGEVGVLEAYASGTAIAEYVRSQVKLGKGSGALKKLAKENKLTAREIGLLAQKGDKLAVAAYKRAARYLGIGLGNLLNVLNPELVIFGGGVWKSAPVSHWKEMIASAKKHSWKQASENLKIVRSKLGDNLGNLGAIALVFDAQFVAGCNSK